MMNILYIADSASYHNALWTSYFADKHKVILFSDQKYGYNKVNFHNNIKIIESKPLFVSKNRHVNKLISIFKYKSEIEKIIKEHNVDIIHSVAIYYAFLSSIISTKLPVIYTQQGSELLVKADRSLFYRAMAKIVFKRSDIVTGDSLAIQHAGYRFGATRKYNYVIQNGVDLRIFTPHAESIRSDLGIPEDAFVVFSPRALEPLYNVDVILKSLKVLKEYGVNFKAIFCFPFGVQYLHELKSMAESLSIDRDILWKGYVDYCELPKYYRCADVVLSLPSSDSSPKSVYESMACGTPVIVTDLPWSYEILRTGYDIIKVPVRDPVATAEAIKNLMMNKVLRENLSKHGIETVANNYSFEANMQKMEEIMLRAVGGTL